MHTDTIFTTFDIPKFLHEKNCNILCHHPSQTAIVGSAMFISKTMTVRSQQGYSFIIFLPPVLFFLKYHTLVTQICICIHEDLHFCRIQAQTSHLPTTGVWVFFCTDLEMWLLVKSIAINTQCFAPTIVTNYKLRGAAWPPRLRPRNLPTVKLFLANHKIHKFTCHTFVICDESHVMNVTDVWNFL